MKSRPDNKRPPKVDPYAVPAIVLTFTSVLIGLIVTGGFEFDPGHRGFENFSNWINDNLFLLAMIGACLATSYALLPDLWHLVLNLRRASRAIPPSHIASRESSVDTGHGSPVRRLTVDSEIDDERGTAPDEEERALEEFVAIGPAAADDRSANADRYRSSRFD